MGCNNHKPRQHRDGKAPWCENCGLTAYFLPPKSRFDNPSKHEPEPELEADVIDMEFDHKDLETCVAEALGAASACWSTLDGAGIFMDRHALMIYDQLMRRIRREMG